MDDDPDFGDLVATFLEREDDRLEVRTATSAAEGLDTIRDRPPDCIVSDYDMPEKNGIEFLQSVRKQREQQLERYERLVEDLPVGAFRTSAADDFLSMNQTLVDIFEAETRDHLHEPRARRSLGPRWRVWDSLCQFDRIPRDLYDTTGVPGIDRA